MGRTRPATSCRTRRDLASSWPAGGPKKLWSRALGEGHSSIVVEDGRLYTLYRTARRRRSGATQPGGSRRRIRRRHRQDDLGIQVPRSRRWHRFLSGLRAALDSSDCWRSDVRDELPQRVLRARQGHRQAVWAHDMIKEYRAPSPLAVATPAARSSTTASSSSRCGGPDQAVAAFDAADGHACVEGGLLRVGARIANPDRRRRPASARRLRRRSDHRAGSGERPLALDRIHTRPTGV